MQREFHIPEQNLHGLKAKFQKLAKRASSTGLPFPELKLGISFTDRVKTANGLPIIIKYRKVILCWEPIAHSDWKVVGKLVHLPEGNLVRSFGEDELPMHYRNASPDCDHCKVKRKRHSTYIIQRGDEFQQTGDDCLQEYLRIGSQNVINAVKYLSSTIDIVQASEALPAIGTSPEMWPLDIYLAHVVDSIKERGWIPRKQARIDGTTATADLAFGRLTSLDTYVPPTSEGIAEATKAIEWAESIPDNSSEYLHNLHIIALSGAVEHRSLGYAASIIPTFRRDDESPIDDKKESEFVGNVGDRSEFELTVDKIVDFETMHGEQSIHIMRDNNFNVFIWRTKDRLDENKTYKLKARIKEHKEYNGVKQTHLFYCKLMEPA